MADESKLLLEDDASRFLLEDGVSFILLEGEVETQPAPAQPMRFVPSRLQRYRRFRAAARR